VYFAYKIEKKIRIPNNFSKTNKEKGTGRQQKAKLPTTNTNRTQQTNGNKNISKSKKVPIVDCFL
jgi:hypothetical protein